MRRALSVFAAVMVLASCDDAKPRPERAEPSASPLSRWDAPSDYDFVVRSRCGEQSFIGTFRISVRDGEVAEAKGLDESAVLALDYMSRGEVPSLEDLVGFARRAQAEDADVAEVVYDETGEHPIRIDIDYKAKAIDDESCFTIRRYHPR